LLISGQLGVARASLLRLYWINWRRYATEVDYGLSLQQDDLLKLMQLLLTVAFVVQEYGDALKIVKVEADPCPNLVEQYKVCGTRHMSHRCMQA
jgi:hypothetical protein